MVRLGPLIRPREVGPLGQVPLRLKTLFLRPDELGPVWSIVVPHRRKPSILVPRRSSVLVGKLGKKSAASRQASHSNCASSHPSPALDVPSSLCGNVTMDGGAGESISGAVDGLLPPTTDQAAA